MTFTEEFESIREAIYHKPWEDSGRLEACLSYALEALARIGFVAERDCTCPSGLNTPRDPACAPFHVEDPDVAREALRRMEMRVRLGDDVRPGEDMAMAWDPPWPRWRETLDDEDLT